MPAAIGVPSVAPAQPLTPRRSHRAPAAYVAPVTVAPITAPDSIYAAAERHCELCSVVGRENADSHSLPYCYANPQNKEHKPWRVRARYRDLVRAGIDMPECMREYAAE